MATTAMMLEFRRNATILAILAGTAAVQFVASSYWEKTPRNTSTLSGKAWVDELLEGHPICFYDNLTMNRHVFRQLLRALNEKAGLGDSKYVTLEEQLAVFLYFSATGCSVQKLEERFQRSPDTISK